MRGMREGAWQHYAEQLLPTTWWGHCVRGLEIAGQGRDRRSRSAALNGRGTTCGAGEVPLAGRRPWAWSHRVDAAGYFCGACQCWPCGAECADREPAGIVEGELGEDPAEQGSELTCVSRARADQYALRPGYVIGDEVPVGCKVVTARAGVELWPHRLGQIAFQEGKHPVHSRLVPGEGPALRGDHRPGTVDADLGCDLAIDREPVVQAVVGEVSVNAEPVRGELGDLRCGEVSDLFFGECDRQLGAQHGQQQWIPGAAGQHSPGRVILPCRGDLDAVGR